MDAREQSLIDRAAARLSPGERPAPMARVAVDWRFAAALTSLIALGPLSTVLGAAMLERRALAQSQAVVAELAPRTAASQADSNAHRRLWAAVDARPVAQWLDAAARALPADARIVTVQRAENGGMEIEILTPDPDPVRAALRRDRAFAGFRERGQRRAGAMILATYRRAA